MLSPHGFGVRFRRQHPIGPYIVDFACIALKLAVELDGSQHFENTADAIRDAYLAERGLDRVAFLELGSAFRSRHGGSYYLCGCRRAAGKAGSQPLVERTPPRSTYGRAVPPQAG